MHAIRSTSNHNHSTHPIRLDGYMPATVHPWYHDALQDHVLIRLRLNTVRLLHLFNLIHLLNMHRSDALDGLGLGLLLML